MAYSSITDIIKAIPESNLIQLTDDANSGTVDNSIVDAAIAEADATINGFLQERYPVPLLPVPELIKSISVDLAVFKLYTRRFEMETPEGIRDRYKNAIKLLEMIQNGKVVIGSGGLNHIYRTNKKEQDKIFGKDLLDDY